MEKQKKDPNAYNWIIQIAGFLSVVGGGIVFIYNQGQKEEAIKSRIFPDAHTAVEVIQHTESAAGEEVYYKALRNLDTIAKKTLEDTEVNAKENFTRDSIRDAEVKKNSVTIFQMKEQLVKKTRLDSIQSETLKEILKEVKSIH